jgi:hypothetical protein
MRATILLLLLGAIPSAGAVQLKADRATTKEVLLSWTPAAKDCKLQLKNSMNAWSPGSPVSGGRFTESKIDPYGTYTYRVECGADTSNEVTVGPPPAGFHLIAAKPDRVPDIHFGRMISIAPDDNRDPAFAFEFQDPNGDGNYSDSELRFISWDRAAYQWKEPVTIATVGNFDPRPPASIVSLARDADTGVWGLVWTDVDSHGVNLVISRDNGATWQSNKVLTDTRALSSPVLAMAGGKIHLIVAQESRNAIRYMTGSLADDPGKWTASFSPLPPGTSGVLRGAHLALDCDGKPAVVYWQKPATGAVWTLAFWRPGSDQAAPIADSGRSGYPPDGVLLAFHGNQPRVLFDARRTQGNVPEHFSTISGDGGATWSNPAPVPDDGNEHLGGYMSFAVAPTGEGAFAGDVLGGNMGGMKCTWPKLARSKDYQTWKTCAPQAGMQPDMRTLWGTVYYNPAGTLYVVFLNRMLSPAQPIKPGIAIWGGR